MIGSCRTKLKSLIALGVFLAVMVSPPPPAQVEHNVPTTLGRDDASHADDQLREYQIASCSLCRKGR